MTVGTERGWVVVHGSASGFAQDVTSHGHHLTSDESVDYGGTDTGPSPYDLLLSALGSCTSMTLGFHARKKKIPLDSVRVRLRHSKLHAKDCAECDTKEGLLDHIEREIELFGELSEEQRADLLSIANRCPVHRTLTSHIRIDSRLV